MAITSFGSKRAQDRPCDVVKIKIKTKSRPELELSLFVVPHICNPLMAQPASNLFRRYFHLSHLKFADNNEGNASLEVDLLIGSDAYWSIVTGEVLKGTGGPAAIKTRLGWVLSGPAECAGFTMANLISTHTLRIDYTEGEIDATLRTFRELESIGVKNKVDLVQDQFTKTSR